MLTGVRETSVKAYYEELPKVGKRQQLILNTLRVRDMTNRELAAFVNLPINSVTPRCKELRELGLVVEKGKVEDPITKKTVTIWGLPSFGQLQLF